MMIGGLCESPLTFRAIVAWHDALKAAGCCCATSSTSKQPKAARAPRVPRPPRAHRRRRPKPSRRRPVTTTKRKARAAALPVRTGRKLKPEVLATFEEIEGLYRKLHKMQVKRLETMTSGEEVNVRSEKSYDKLREELVGNVERVRLHNNRIEELVTQLKLLNQRLTGSKANSCAWRRAARRRARIS